ncbi:MAG: 4Fe-4S binding protein [Alloprevotella sp.]
MPNFDMNEQVKMNKHIPENLASFKDDISKQKHWMQPVSEEECEQHAGFMAYTRLDPEVGFMIKSEKYFVITDRCIGCGVCTDICPRGYYYL